MPAAPPDAAADAIPPTVPESPPRATGVLPHASPASPASPAPERPGFFRRISQQSATGGVERPGFLRKFSHQKEARTPSRSGTPSGEHPERPGLIKRISQLSEKGSAFPSRPLSANNSTPGTPTHERTHVLTQEELDAPWTETWAKKQAENKKGKFGAFVDPGGGSGGY